MSRLSIEWRLPIRLKLTLLFTGVMAVLLAALSGFLYLRFRSDLDYNINQSLRARAAEIASLVRNQDVAHEQGPGEALPGRGENFVQILDPDGKRDRRQRRIPHPTAADDRGEVRRAATRPLLLQRGQSLRLYAIPVNHGSSIVVAGVSLAERNAAYDNLEDTLVTGGPLALVLATVLAYGLAAAALRPVESMRRRAASISASEPDARLPLPSSVDEVHRLGSTLNEMLDRLQDGLQRERTFLADASHELRTPLAVLKAELEVTLREDGTVAQLRDALSSAAEETDRIIRLAEDLLVLARAEQGQLPIQRRRVTLTELLGKLGERLEPIAEHAGRSLEIDDQEFELIVEVDLDRLGQALGNMLDNALRYGRGTVSLGALVRERFLELHLIDEGPGFDAEFLPRAFERFSRQDPARSRGGAGLGLSIVRVIAQAHGGYADARNPPQGGADVWLRIPCARPHGLALRLISCLALILGCVLSLREVAPVPGKTAPPGILLARSARVYP